VRRGATAEGRVVSGLSHGGTGLGTAFGEQVARQLIADAGLVDLTVHEAPSHPIDVVCILPATPISH
jgi:hypothetical protein